MRRCVTALVWAMSVAFAPSGSRAPRRAVRANSELYAPPGAPAAGAGDGDDALPAGAAGVDMFGTPVDGDGSPLGGGDDGAFEPFGPRDPDLSADDADDADDADGGGGGGAAAAMAGANDAFAGFAQRAEEEADAARAATTEAEVAAAAAAFESDVAADAPKKYEVADYESSEWKVGVLWRGKTKIDVTWIRLKEDAASEWGWGANGKWSLDDGQFVSVTRDFLLGWSGRRIFSAKIGADPNFLEGVVRGWKPFESASIMGQWQAIRLNVGERGEAPWWRDDADTADAGANADADAEEEP